MNGFDISLWGAGLLLIAAAGCDAEPALRPVSPGAQLVRVENFDPPAGARLAGPIQVSDGEGCGIGGTRGSLANATAALKEAAARRGVTFVKLTHVTKPYSGRDCYHLEYSLEGLAYYLDGAPPLVAPQHLSASAECSPPCSPGYACSAGVCAAECSPACSPTQICRADRVCVPAPTP
ncbi:MAG TPA: hypothetical protein VHW01_10270 [Polyangiaceae bacterium]|jgi:hypothetical protein|nr:hypothetical protein [Polyangiaceae bacterium]